MTHTAVYLCIASVTSRLLHGIMRPAHRLINTFGLLERQPFSKTTELYKQDSIACKDIL